MKKILFVTFIVLGLAGTALAAAKDGVTIKTDKRRYKGKCEAEKINLTIVNNSPNPVYLSDLSFEEVDLSVGFHWERLDNAMGKVRPFIKTRLMKGEKVEVEVKPSFAFYQECPVGTRKYRIAGVVYSQCPGVGADYFPEQCVSSKDVYSNEFTVKWEKK